MSEALLVLARVIVSRSRHRVIYDHPFGATAGSRAPTADDWPAWKLLHD